MTLLVHKQAMTFADSNGNQQFTVVPKQGPQNAPDWVRDTETYKAAVKSGFIAEIAVITPQPAQIEEPAKDPADLAEVGLLSPGTSPKSKVSK